MAMTKETKDLIVEAKTAFMEKAVGTKDMNLATMLLDGDTFIEKCIVEGIGAIGKEYKVKITPPQLEDFEEKDEE